MSEAQLRARHQERIEELCAAAIRALVLEQMRLEPAVAKSPEPVVSVRSDGTGNLSVQVRYADADTADAQTLNIEVPR